MTAQLPLWRPRAVRAGLVGGLALGAGVSLTATSAWLVVRAAERPVILTLLTAVVAVRAFGIARPLLRYVERLRAHDAVLDDLAGTRSRVYRELVRLGQVASAGRSQAATLSGVVDDVTDVAEAQVRVTVPLLAAAVAALGGSAVAWFVTPLAGVVVAGYATLVTLALALGARDEARTHERLTGLRAAGGRVTGRGTHRAAEVAAVGGTDRLLELLDAAHRRVAAGLVARARTVALVDATVTVGGGVAAVLCALAAAGSGHGAAVTALAVLVPLALAEAWAGVPDAVRALAAGRAAAGRLAGALDLPPAVRDTGATGVPATPGSRVPELELRDVTATWPGRDTTAVGPVSLRVPPGTVLALTGPSGSGKSTLLAVLARRLDPASGSVSIDGVDVRELAPDAVRELVAVVDDDPYLFATTVRDNLRLARPTASDTDIQAALDDAGLRRWREALPRGLDSRLGSGGEGVSGGERARLGLARALLSRRPVLLLDEPTAHLDHETAADVLGELWRHRGGRTVIVAGHHERELVPADGMMELRPAAPRSTARNLRAASQGPQQAR